MENKENKLFINKTTYSAKVYEEFLKFHTKRYNLGYWLYTIIWCMILFFCIIIAFGSEMRTQGVLITIILISFIGYRIVRPKLLVNREIKSEKISENNSNTFTFYDKHILVSNNNGKFEYKYIMLRRIFETNTFFYLYVSKENAFLIDKKCFSLGTTEEFSKFISSKCKLKYKRFSE